MENNNHGKQITPTRHQKVEQSSIKTVGIFVFNRNTDTKIERNGRISLKKYQIMPDEQKCRKQWSSADDKNQMAGKIMRSLKQIKKNYLLTRKAETMTGSSYIKLHGT